MRLEIKVPVVGESITEGVLVSWLKDDGAAVQVDEPLFELETDKITLTAPAEGAGRLSILVQAESKVKVGQVVGTLETAALTLAAAKDNASTVHPAASSGPPSTPPADGPPISAPAGFPQVEAKLTPAAHLEELSPAVRRLVEEHHLDPNAVTGTGKNDRLTKEDVVRYLESGKNVGTPKTLDPAPRIQSPLQGESAGTSPSQDPRARQTRKPMSSLRQRLAERLVQAQQTAAILTTFNEVDMTEVMALRTRYKEIFQKRYETGLGFMSFFVKASIEALKAVPIVNAQIQGEEIVTNHFYDIGVAVGTEHGLVVPVIRDADTLSFAQLELAIAAQARRARERTLNLSDLLGGTFTLSNGGVYGSLLSTPILNPPQSGILGLHGIKKRPVVIDDEIVIRPMMYLALSYDHRLVDGQQAVTFLRRIVECIERPERLLLEV